MAGWLSLLGLALLLSPTAGLRNIDVVALDWFRVPEHAVVFRIGHNQTRQPPSDSPEELNIKLHKSNHAAATPYRCRLRPASPPPPPAVKRNYTRQDVKEILDAMELHRQPCILHNAGYWTYEFCPQMHVRQFYQYDPKDRRVTAEQKKQYVLGSHGHWLHSEVLLHEQPGESVEPSLVLTWGGGTPCEMSHSRRMIRINYLCRENVLDSYVWNIREVSTCTYEMVVLSSKLCPLLRPVQFQPQRMWECQGPEPPEHKPKTHTKPKAKPANAGTLSILETSTRDVIEALLDQNFGL